MPAPLTERDFAIEVVRRLRDAGKPARLALVAAMRKLLTILNAILRDQRPWAPAQN